jgi:hypothetical protein
MTQTTHPGRPAGRRAGALLATVLVALALAVAGCGSSGSSSSASSVSGGGPAATSGASSATTSTSHTNFAKTKFVLHAGLAFGAFHHFIYKPFRAGDFRHPFSHKLTIVKAALAAAFVDHEVKLALTDAKSSPTLSKLVSPITALDNKLHGLGSELRSGNTGSVSADNGSISSIESQSSQSGAPIQEQTPSASSL